MAGEAKQASAFVRQKIMLLSESKNESAVRAALAKLRRGVGKAPGSQPDLWDLTLGDLPETLISNSGKPTSGEWAIHSALTLFALHQQGRDLKKQRMSAEGEYLGLAARKLVVPDKSNEKAVVRRFNAVAVADSFERFCWHLRGLIQQLKANDIPLDYIALAEDMYWFHLPDRRDSLRLRWGQDFFRTAKSAEQGSQ